MDHRIGLFQVGDEVQWNWMGRQISGVVCEVYTDSVEKQIKGKRIKRNGTAQNPACLVESKAGNLALKLTTELAPQSSGLRSKSKPSMFANFEDEAESE